MNIKAETTTITTDSTGINNGFYYSFRNQGGGSVAMTLGDSGNFGVNWSNCSNFACGKGWITCSPDDQVEYSGKFNGGTNGYLALYGYTKNPVIEYYIIENYGTWVPPGGNAIASLQSDGATYYIYRTQRTTPSTITGIVSSEQFYSLRTSKRASGTITFSNHVNAWKNKGMNLGKIFSCQMMVVEGNQSTGSANITVMSYRHPIYIPTYSNTPTPIHNKYGDVNDDETVDSADYSVLRHYLLGKISSLPSYENADVNGDNTVDSADYTILRKYLLEEITSFPVN